jgi:proline dehydrogenase
LLGRAVLLKLADSPNIARFVKKNGMSAGFARRFVAGETMEETVDPVRALNARGIPVSLDYLGENVNKESEAMESVAYYHRLFDFIAANGLDANVSLKLTQLGLDLGDELAYSNMTQILERASDHGQFVRIDMEGAEYTERTLAIFYKLWEGHKNVGAVIQSYLYRSAKDVEMLIGCGARVRLVKGAYNETKEVAFQSKAEVDRQFVDLMERLLTKGNYPAIATHDEQMIQATIRHATEEQIEPSRFEFQMLYGIRRERQEQIVRDGYRMRVYVPFGTQWYAYMMRRMAERPANLWFVLKNLLRR